MLQRLAAAVLGSHFVLRIRLPLRNVMLKKFGHKTHFLREHSYQIVNCKVVGTFVFTGPIDIAFNVFAAVQRMIVGFINPFSDAKCFCCKKERTIDNIFLPVYVISAYVGSLYSIADSENR